MTTDDGNTVQVKLQYSTVPLVPLFLSLPILPLPRLSSFSSSPVSLLLPLKPATRMLSDSLQVRDAPPLT